MGRSGGALGPREFADLEASVLSDIRWLDAADLTRADEPTLRDASSRLRRLLVDEKPTLQRLRKALGLKGEPRITTLMLPGADGASFSQAGGANRNGLTVAGVRRWDRALSEDEIRARLEEWKAGPTKEQRPMSKWLASRCMTVGGVAVTRRDVIKYVANKLGGVHLDGSRDATKEPGYIALDMARDTYKIADLDSPYAELAAIAQQILASPEVRALIN